MSTATRCLVRRDTYRDSVELMRVAAEAERLPGVVRAAVMMGTPANRELLAAAGLLAADAAGARPTDLVIAIAALDADAAEAALSEADRLLAQQVAPAAAGPARLAAPRTMAEAQAQLEGANLAIVSTPGAYATAEALKALKRGLHVFLFSDNVPIAEEVELKRLAVRKRRLVMGPDCGTAILDGVPLGFANAVCRGSIGLAGASGTGLQEVSCLVDRLGAGVSQVIGVGGRDLDERVGGLMMRAAIERLGADLGTRVIALVSKPPAPRVARDILAVARTTGKPVIACFLGGDPSAIEAAGAMPAATLEAAARLAVALARGVVGATAPNEAARPAHGDAPRPGHLGATAPVRPDAPGDGAAAVGSWPANDDRVRAHVATSPSRAGRVRGLFSGGTLCQEAKLILAAEDDAAGHTAVDLGDDEFTVGRPHPMLDFRVRNERIAAAAEDAATAVVLLDVVLGYAAHPDPAGALIPAIGRAREQAARSGRALAVVASVCGTPGDPQDLASQESRLRAAGVLLAPSNAEAARLAARLAAEGAHP